MLSVSEQLPLRCGSSPHFKPLPVLQVCRGKNVVVVGGGKSSIDCVVAATKKGAKAATLVFRTAHWPVPRKLLNLVPFKWGTYSRFGNFMFTMHYDVSPLWKYLHGVLAPLKWLWWRIVETMFRVQATAVYLTICRHTRICMSMCTYHTSHAVRAQGGPAAREPN